MFPAVHQRTEEITKLVRFCPISSTPISVATIQYSTSLSKVGPHSEGSRPTQVVGIGVLGSLLDSLRLVDRSHDSQPSRMYVGALDYGSQVLAVEGALAP